MADDFDCLGGVTKKEIKAKKKKKEKSRALKKYVEKTREKLRKS